MAEQRKEGARGWGDIKLLMEEVFQCERYEQLPLPKPRTPPPPPPPPMSPSPNSPPKAAPSWRRSWHSHQIMFVSVHHHTPNHLRHHP